MHRAMSSRPLCTSDGDPPPPNRCKHLHEPGIAKVRRTRKAPDFYSPENASKTCARPKKSISDDNDSWKPESETDEVNSESDAERSDGRREKSGTRRRMLSRKSPCHDEEHAEMDTDEHPLPPEQHGETGEKAVASSDTDVEEKSAKEKKRDGKNNKEKRVKGCRELQDLLDGCVQVHKESRTRRLAPRREHSRTLQITGHSDTSWSNGSSRAATEKDSGNHHRQHLQNSSKQQSSLNTSSAQDLRRTVDSSTENPTMAEISETVEDDSKPFVSTRRSTHYGRNNMAATCTRKSKTTTAETVSDSSVRVKRQRVDMDTSQTRKITKGVENGANGAKASMRDTSNKDDGPPVIKLPRMPMIRYGEYWYRARIKQENHECVYVEFTGFEDGSIKPFWIRKDSVDVFKGSYSGKDWKHVGDGAWEPKPRKVNSKKQNNRGRRRGNKRGGHSRTADTRDQSKASQEYTDQAYTGDSEKCSNPASGIASGSGDRIYYRKTSGEGQERGCLEKMRSTDSVARVESPIQEEKDMDCGSQSDVPVKDRRSDDAFPKASAVTAQQRTSIDAAQEKCKSDGRSDFATKPISGGSPFSRNAGTSGGSSQLEDTLNRDGKKNSRHVAENNKREHSSSRGNEQSEGRMPTRLRRKPGKVSQERQQQEEDRTLVVKRPKPLRRSRRLCPKGSWGRFKDESSSEAEYNDDGLNTPASRRNGNATTCGAAMSKYLTRSSRQTDATGRRNSLLTASQPLPRTSQVQKPSHRSIFHSAKRGRKTIMRRDEMKDEYYEDKYDEVFENEDLRAEYRSPRNRLEAIVAQRRLEKTIPVVESSDGAAVWNLGVNVLSQIRKYLPYYCNHIADARLSAFVELMERLDGVRLKNHASSSLKQQSSEIPPSKDPVPISSVALPTEVSDKTLGLPSLIDREKL